MAYSPFKYDIHLHNYLHSLTQIHENTWGRFALLKPFQIA